MTADTLAKALGGRRAGGGWMARCPAHDDRDPSLSIRDGANGQVLVRCHAGCSQRQVIAALRTHGLWPAGAPHRSHRPAGRAVVTERLDRDPARRTKAALSIWQSARPADGTPVETYLATRGLNAAPPPTLRFHAGLKHPSGTVWPAMVALVTRGSDDQPLAIHRTFLGRTGAGKAPVDPSKMMLGLRALDLPRTCREVIVLADGDDAGEAAARDGARHWTRDGHRVRIARPPRGMDFNDLLTGCARHLPEGAE